LQEKLPSTGTWNDYKTLEAGVLEISETGVGTFVFKPKAFKKAFCNLRSITLTPVK
jgi:hypothetical protein